MAEGLGIGVKTEADGSVVVDLNVRRRPEARRTRSDQDKFNANLAEELDETTLQTIAQELMDGVQADIQSRQEWTNNYNEGMQMLGLLLEKPGQLNANTSKIRHPLLAHAIIEFQAQASGEMLPAAGPVKVDNTSQQIPQEVAEALERDLNFYLRTTAAEYYPDTDRGLYYLGYGGTIFKKVYTCPLRRRPVSECVYLPDLIISNDTVHISQARRVTHQIEGFTRNRILQMMDSGWWAEVTLQEPVPAPSSTRTAEARVSGVTIVPTLSVDKTHTVWESSTWINLKRFGHDDKFAKDKPEDLELPYLVTMDKDSRQIYRIARNWRKDSTYYFPRQRFVKWGMVPGIGYLDQGYLNMLGQTEMALTALERILIDAGVYSIFPGGVRVKGRMDSNEIRPGPGEYPEMETGGLPIQQAIMPLPFKGPAGEVLALLQHLEQLGQKMAGAPLAITKDGIKDIPVGTMMALVEQNAIPQIAVHKRLHVGQKEELMLLRDEFRDMGEEGVTLLKQRDKEQPYTAEQLFSASLIPASDPEMPAHIHRFMQATALEGLYTEHPEMYNGFEVQRRILEMARIHGIDEILIPPQPQAEQPDPTMMLAQAQIDALMQELQIKKGSAEAKAMIDKINAETRRMVDTEKLKLQREKQEQELASRAATEQSKTDADLDRATLEAAQKEEAAARDAEVRLAETDKKLESQEAIAAMHDQTTLIVEGIRADQAPTEDKPARDKKSGP